MFLKKFFLQKPVLKRDSNKGVFLCIFQNFWERLFWKISSNGCFWLFFILVIYLLSAVSLQFKRIMKKMFMVKKIFIEIRLCNPMTHVFKGHVRIIKIYMVKFIVSIINKLKIMFFFVNPKYINKHNVIFKKILTKLVTVLTKCFSSISEPYKLP